MRRASLWFALFLCAAALYPFSLTLTGGADNFVYDPNGTNSANTFSLPSLVPIVNVAIDGEFSDFSRYKIAFESDPVLRKFFYADTIFNLWLFRLGVGAFLSVFNDGDEAYFPGVIGSIGLEIPGGFSVYAEYGMNIFTDLSKTGNIHLDYGKIDAALWLPFILCRFVMQKKSFAVTPSGRYIRTDSLVRYQLTVDLFSKSSTLALTLGAGIETLKRSIEPANAGSSIPFQDGNKEARFALLGISWELSPSLSFLGNVEIPFYPVAIGTFFKAAAGITITIPDS
jgi:hypothetical protein